MIFARLGSTYRIHDEMNRVVVHVRQGKVSDQYTVSAYFLVAGPLHDKDEDDVEYVGRERCEKLEGVCDFLNSLKFYNYTSLIERFASKFRKCKKRAKKYLTTYVEKRVDILSMSHDISNELL